MRAGDGQNIPGTASPAKSTNIEDILEECKIGGAYDNDYKIVRQCEYVIL